MITWLRMATEEEKLTNKINELQHEIDAIQRHIQILGLHDETSGDLEEAYERKHQKKIIYQMILALQFRSTVGEQKE